MSMKLYDFKIECQIIFYFQFMKISIYSLALFFVLFLTVQSNEQQTHLTFFVEYQEQQEEDYIEMSLTIQAQDISLVEAIKNAAKTADKVTNLANNYCKQNTKKGKGDCKEAVEISKFDIDPKYQMVRKQSTFSSFVVSHEVTLKIFGTENIGYLVDNLLKNEGLTIEGFEWKPLEEVDSEEAAIKAGFEQGEGLCEQVGLSLGKILNIEEVDEEQEEEEKGQEQDEEEEDEEPKITTYKFEVQCVKGKPKAK